ncbi:MAG: hypothetical protein HRU18_28350 [Pseudoalteromonas sp.]|uniref:hypothetical protein n=1 Tax=Pseudoalteromonas sp. TaxID=53249 RepID=UPI001D62BB0A|nr:hypothetical protein [Pseudoalteromonas sp.]NRA82123.1 hypothetical protein [Pseudoalteromonas sp.]
MPPQIIASGHDKSLRSATNLRIYESMEVIDSTLVSDVGPNNEIVRFSLMVSEAVGTVSIELQQPSNIFSPIGNVDFEFWENDGGVLDDGVAIYSAVVSQDYRGLGLALEAYKLICSRFKLISDDSQTHDGAAFWKYKLSLDDDIEVSIVLNPDGDPAYYFKPDGKTMYYSGDNELFEPYIWGKEYYTDEHPEFIKTDNIESRVDVRLVAVRINEN